MKLYSSIVALVGILALVVMPTQREAYTEQDYLDIVSKSFMATKADFYELKIEGWEQINKKGLSKEEIIAYYSQISRELNIDQSPQLNDTYEDFISIYQRAILEDDVTIDIAVQSFLSEGLEAGTYLGVQLTTTDQRKGRKYYNLISPLFSQKEKVGVTIIGGYGGKLDKEQLYGKIATGFSQVGANIVEGIDTQQLISLSAYTPQCKKHLKVDGKRLNINIAARYHSLGDKTYIHVGSPIIYQEY